MVRFIDEKTLLVNDYRQCNPKFGRRIAAALRGFELVPFPYCPTGEVVDGIESAEGVYINFLQIRDVIFAPVFGLEADNTAMDVLAQAFPMTRLVGLCSSSVARGAVS